MCIAEPRQGPGRVHSLRRGVQPQRHQDPRSPDFAALAAEARCLEARVVCVSTRTKDFKTVLIVETTGLTTPEVSAMSDALKSFRRRRDLAAEFLIVNTTGGEFVSKVPSGWPP